MKTLHKLSVLGLALAMSLSLLAGCASTTSDPGAAQTPSAPPAGSAAPSGSQAPAGDASFTTVEPGKLVLSTNAEFAPYEMLDDSGKPIGIDMEVGAAIAEKLGLELQIDDMGFDAALLAVQNGQSDIAMAGITVDKERLEVMDFTDSYATGVQVVIVKEGSDVTLDNLGEKTIGTQMGTTGFIYCTDDYGEDHVIGYETGAVAVQALVNGQIDAVVIDNLPAQSYVENAEGLTILDTEYAVEDYAIAVKKGNTALLEAVNAAMADLKADGTFQSIVDKYIKAD